MSAFEVDVDGRILGGMDAQRRVNQWMTERYRQDVQRRSGAGSPLLMDFLKACADSVRIREATGVSSAKPVVASSPRVEVTAAVAGPLMGCSAQYVRKLARLGRVPARRIGRLWLIDVTSLEEAA